MMSPGTPPKLLRSCLIQGGRIQVDGAEVFVGSAGSFASFAREAYQALEIDYPKFFRMDNLARLGFLAAEYLLAGRELHAADEGGRTGIVLANANSSLDTDLQHEHRLRQGMASPALFVYTLPNIAVGELCIRHGIKGESLLLVEDRYHPAAQVAYITGLLSRQRLDRCLGGWLDLLGQDYRALLYLVGPGDAPGQPAYTAAEVERLFGVG